MKGTNKRRNLCSIAQIRWLINDHYFGTNDSTVHQLVDVDSRLEAQGFDILCLSILKFIIKVRFHCDWASVIRGTDLKIVGWRIQIG